MAFWNRKTSELEESGTVTFTDRQIKVGAQFPPEQSIERIAKYRRTKALYDGKTNELYARATGLLRDTPHAAQLEKLYIAVNLASILATKPADLLVGEAPIFDSGLADDTPQQKAINSYVEENDLVKLIHESALSNGYRGDAWIKTRYGYRQDYSALAELGVGLPVDATLEPIVEHVTADCVFPETSNGNVKKFKAVDIASVEWVIDAKKDTPYLNVERHLPGYIVYEKYRLETFEGGVNNEYGYAVQIFKIVEQVATGRESDVDVTEVPTLLVQHIPYKSTDDTWEGKGTIEEIETLLMAINDRLAQIDYVLWKHTDPATYGPKLGDGGQVRTSGTYIEVTKDDATPGYMTWNSELNGAFKELETLIAMVFQVAETPQWLFGTVLGSDNAGGTGTSHTDGAAIKARFLPILSKVNRIKTHYDRAIRDALYNCQLLDIAHGEADFEAVYPTIAWRDGLPKNEKEQAEIAQIRTGGKSTLDVATAIKRLDNLDDMQASEIVSRIDADTEKEIGTVDANIFNEPTEEVDA